MGKRVRRKRRTGRIMAAVILLLVLSAAVFAAVRNAEIRKLETGGYPKQLVDLAKRNRETCRFVKNYYRYRQTKFTIDLQGEVQKGEIPLFLQWDKRWGYRKYGGNYLALTGCGPTSLSMVYCGLTGDTRWNPLKTARWAEKQGYYIKGQGSSWDLMSKGGRRLGLKVKQRAPEKEEILSALESGKAIIASVGPGDFTSSGHFIVLTGVSAFQRISVNDPNSRRRSRSWDADRLIRQIRQVWIFG